MKCNHLRSPEETNTAATMTACKARFTLCHTFIRELKLSEKRQRTEFANHRFLGLQWRYLKTEAEELHTECAQWETTREKGGREIYFLILSETCPDSAWTSSGRRSLCKRVQPHTIYGMGEHALWRVFDFASMHTLLHFLQDFHAVQPLPCSAARLFILR